MAIRIINTTNPLCDPRVLELRDRLRTGDLTATGTRNLDVPGIVRDIIADVAARGDQAVVELTERIDKVSMTPEQLRVPADRIAEAHAAADPQFLALARRTIANIRQYQQHILHVAPPDLPRGARRLGVRYTPIDRVGLYVPGWRALYPSTVLMTAVPAQVAGVGQIAITSPPTDDGVNEMVLVLAGELGIDEVYRAGGAIGVAALALGTERIPAAEMIAGPGNAFVAEAKKQLFGKVQIDSLAGPSEVLIVADDSADPAWLAADLLAQAEHDPGSAVLVTPSIELAGVVVVEIEAQLPKLDRAEAIAKAMEQYSGIIIVPGLETACDVANDFAPEHLQVIVEDEQAALAAIRHAGAIFIGANTPVPVGDYYAGASHVLPTAGTARFFSPLSANDFLKSSSVIAYNASSLADDAEDIIDFATREGLTAHAEAVRKRIQSDNS